MRHPYLLALIALSWMVLMAQLISASPATMYYSYAPLALKQAQAQQQPIVRGSAGWANVPLPIQWAYDWNHLYGEQCGPYPVTGCAPIVPFELVNSVRSSPTELLITWNCPKNIPVQPPLSQAVVVQCLQDYAHARPGAYWLVGNEWDVAGYPETSDGITVERAIDVWNVIEPAIHSADPTARLIICGCLNIDYLTPFVAAIDMSKVVGVATHIYASLSNPTCGTDQCLMQAFGTRVYQQRQWMNAHAPGKEWWVTEFNVRPDNLNHDETLRNLQMMCTLLKMYGVNRFAYFTGGNYTSAVSISLTANADLAMIYGAC